MQNPSYRATTRFDLPTLKLGSALHLRNRHPLFLLIRYLYLIFIPVGIILLVLGDRLFGFLCIIIGPVLFMRKVFWQYRLIHHTKSSPQANQKLHWTFTADGIQQKSNDHQKSFLWNDFTDRFLSPKGFLLYLQPDQYFIVPKSAFHHEKDFEAVTTLCQNKITPPLTTQKRKG